MSNRFDLHKRLFRIIRYKNERKKIFRERLIRRQQNDVFGLAYSQSLENLIMFVVPGANWFTGEDDISGGIMSIVSICEETLKLELIHCSKTIMCTPNGENLLWKHKKFNNNTNIFRFKQVVKRCRNIKRIIIHLPEFMTATFMASLKPSDKRWLRKVQHVHINVLNQNILLMPSKDELGKLQDYADKITITTAHQKYCSVDKRNEFGFPLHKLSVWISPEQYVLKGFAEKENLIVVSPDKQSGKEEFIELLKKRTGYKVQIIKNLTYSEYKELIARAKWSITFGEGLDGYFIEPVFSGSVSFGIYNNNFFTPDFEEIPTLYTSTEELFSKIADDILLLDNIEVFSHIQRRQYELCSFYYSKETYTNNIIAFYEGRYTYE